MSFWLSVTAVTSLPWLCPCPGTCPQLVLCSREPPGLQETPLLPSRVMPVARSIWGSWDTALWCFSPWLWFCHVFGGGMPWPVRITHCYPVTSRCSHPSHVKVRAQAQPDVHNLFFHLRTPLHMLMRDANEDMKDVQVSPLALMLHQQGSLPLSAPALWLVPVGSL